MGTGAPIGDNSVSKRERSQAGLMTAEREQSQGESLKYDVRYKMADVCRLSCFYQELNKKGTMKKETLARAKELEKDIQQMEFALSYYKRGQWSHWDINDRASSFHFEFCKNWSHRDADMQDLPTWLNKPLMEVVEREMERCKHELETLGSEQEEINMKPGDEIPDKTKDGIQASDIREDEWKLPKKKKRPKVLSMFYALLLCLFYVALSIGVNILSHKLFGLYCGIDSITFSMVFTIIWVLCYIHISED